MASRTIEGLHGGQSTTDDDELEREWRALQTAIGERQARTARKELVRHALRQMVDREQAATSSSPSSSPSPASPAVLPLSPQEERFARGVAASTAAAPATAYASIVDCNKLLGRNKPNQRVTRETRPTRSASVGAASTNPFFALAAGPAPAPLPEPVEDVALQYAELALDNAWECTACTFYNSLDAAECAMCLSARSPDARRLHDPATPDGAEPGSATAPTSAEATPHAPIPSRATVRPATSKPPLKPEPHLIPNPNPQRRRRHRAGNVLQAGRASYLGVPAIEPRVATSAATHLAASLAAAAQSLRQTAKRSRVRSKRNIKAVVRRDVDVVVRQRAVYVVALQPGGAPQPAEVLGMFSSESIVGCDLSRAGGDAAVGGVVATPTAPEVGGLVGLLVVSSSGRAFCHVFQCPTADQAGVLVSTIASIRSAPGIKSGPGRHRSVHAVVPPADGALPASRTPVSSPAAGPQQAVALAPRESKTVRRSGAFGLFRTSSVPKEEPPGVFALYLGSFPVGHPGPQGCVEAVLQLTRAAACPAAVQKVVRLGTDATALTMAEDGVLFKRFDRDQVAWVGGCPSSPTHFAFITRPRLAVSGGGRGFVCHVLSRHQTSATNVLLFLGPLAPSRARSHSAAPVVALPP